MRSKSKSPTGPAQPVRRSAKKSKKSFKPLKVNLGKKFKEGDKVEVTSKFSVSKRDIGSKGTVMERLPSGGLNIKWDDGKKQQLKPASLKKIKLATGRRRLVAAPPVCHSLPMLTNMSPCVSSSVALLVILPLLYLVYVLVVRRTRAPKRRRSSRTGLHASNPLGIYEPVEPYF